MVIRSFRRRNKESFVNGIAGHRSAKVALRHYRGTAIGYLDKVSNALMILNGWTRRIILPNISSHWLININ